MKSLRYVGLLIVLFAFVIHTPVSAIFVVVPASFSGIVSALEKYLVLKVMVLTKLVPIFP